MMSVDAIPGRAHFQITLGLARTVLFWIWFTFSLVIFGLFAIQTNAGVFGADSAQAWAWLLPHISPTLSIIVASYMTTPTRRDAADAIISRRGVFLMALAWSVFYLLWILWVVWAERSNPEPIFEQYQNANLFLGVIQGIVAVFMAIFFMSEHSLAAATKPPKV